MKNKKIAEVLENIKNKKSVLEIKKTLESVLKDKAVKAIARKEKEVNKRLFKEAVDVLSKLKEISDSKKIRNVTFNDGSTLAVDSHTASAIIEAYKNTNKKDKFVEMASKNEKSFLVIVDYSFRKTDSI